jgi:hypothetical protein
MLNLVKNSSQHAKKSLSQDFNHLNLPQPNGFVKGALHFEHST